MVGGIVGDVDMDMDTNDLNHDLASSLWLHPLCKEFSVCKYLASALCVI